MLELLSSIAILAIVAVFVTIIIRERQKESLYKEIQESNKKLLVIAESQQTLSKQLINFIDKNINERIVYVDPQTGYTNEHKFEKEEKKDEEDEEVFQVPEDMTPEQLAEHMEGKKEEGNKTQ